MPSTGSIPDGILSVDKVSYSSLSLSKPRTRWTCRASSGAGACQQLQPSAQAARERVTGTA